MYEKIKTTLTGYPKLYYIVGAVVLISGFCLWYIFHQSSGADYQRTLNAVERAQEQQRESVELNEAHNTISTLETELMKAKMLSMKQEVTLSEMQNSLTELKGQIENDKRTIKRLRMQRNLSQMVGVGAVIGVVIHR